MIDGAVAFFMGMLSMPLFFIGLILFALILDHKEARGWTVVFLLMAGWSAWVIFGLSWQQIAMAAGAWIPIGLFWSVWRWRRYCSHIVKKVQEHNYDRDYAKRDVDPTYNKGKLVYWVFAWPISLIESLIGDILDMVEVLVMKVFRGTYAKISANAVVEIDNARK